MKYQIVATKAQRSAFEIEVLLDKDISKQDLLRQNLSTLSLSGKEAFKSLLSCSFEPERSGDKRYIFSVKKSNATKVLYQIALTRQLFYCDEKIIYEPFSKSEFYYQVEKDADKYKVTGLFELGRFKVQAHLCDLLFEGDEIFYLHKGMLSQIKTECDFLWIEKVKSSPLVLSKPDLDELVLEMKLDNLSPSLKVEKDLEIQETISCIPELVLQDRQGLFANLWMDYGSFGKVEFGKKEKLKITRNEEEESGWEQDLLESGYFKKRGPFFSYACDKQDLGESLKFLIELGWKVLDHNKKRVKLISRNDLQLTLEENEVILKGELAFDGERASLDQVTNSLTQNQDFVELSNSSVGLLEGVSFAKHFTKDGDYHLSKTHLGLLNDAHENLIEENLKELLSLQRLEAIPSQKLKDFSGSLFEYQKKGFDWLCFLYKHKLGGLLADEMGLGKTVQVLAFLAFVGLGKKHLIVVPSALKGNWAKECERFLGFKPKLFSSVNNEITQGLWIVSYSMLREHSQLIGSHRFDTLILDEAQMIKNPDAKTSKAVFSMVAQFKLAMTGTPIENKPLDLWSIFRFIQPGILSERKTFELDQKDPKQRAKLSKIIRPFILRRKKEDVGLDLPERIEQTVYIELSDEERCLYENVRNQGRNTLTHDSKPLDILEILLRLRQICCHPFLAKEEGESSKLQQVLLDIGDIVSSGRKVMIVSQFTSLLGLVKQQLEIKGLDFLTIDGSTRDRQGVVDKFQSGPDQILLMSLKAGGVGLNITKADYVLIYDPWWNKAAEEQAIARAHRIGRKKSVFVKRYVVLESVEEKIQKLKEEKSALFSQVIDFESNVDHFDLNELEGLLG